MSSAIERAKALNFERMQCWARSKEIAENAQAAGGLTAEDHRNVNAALARIDEIDIERNELMSSDEARREIEMMNEEVRRISTPGERAGQSRAEVEARAGLGDFFRPKGTPGQVDAVNIDLEVARRAHFAVRAGLQGPDLRAALVTDGGATGGSLTVPTTVANTVYAFMVQSMSVRSLARIITTPSGAPMAFPRVTTHSVGTQIASQTTAGTLVTDPVLGAMTLSAYDFGGLTSVSNDMLEDSAVDVAGFVGAQLGRTVGLLSGTAYVLGTGSSQPTGIITAAPTGIGGTVATGGTTVFPTGAVDPFIDLQYSVADSYRKTGNAAFLVNQKTGNVLRKARDGAGGTIGQYLWQPSPTVGLVPGQPDRFLGDAILYDSNVASIASDSKIAVYGNWDAYYIRDANGLRLERSNDLYFNLNQVAFRAILRSDGNAVDLHAFNVLKMSVT